LSPELRTSDSWDDVASAGIAALDQVSATIHALQLLEKALGEAASRIADPLEALAEAAADVAGWREEMELAAKVLELLVDGAPDDVVVWLEVDRRPDWQDEAVRVAPLDVGDELGRGLFGGHRAVVCTSATLDAGDSFRHFTASVGLDRIDRAPELLKVPSPFDFATQMGVYVVSDMPDPREPDYRDALAGFLVELHRASGGGALTLFTSRSDMESVHEVVEPLLAEEGLPLLCQGRTGSTRRLADEFRADPSASLMATRSFWQGFDAPGETLRVVVIARLPFGYFGDPLAEALRERVGQSRWWADHYLPKAVLDLKQAAGRLIRSPTDRGVVVLADSRVTSKHYGQRFLRALPTREAVLAPSQEVVERTAAMFGG
jgi:ATP-dependent DNA helicase DinG